MVAAAARAARQAVAEVAAVQGEVPRLALAAGLEVPRLAGLLVAPAGRHGPAVPEEGLLEAADPAVPVVVGRVVREEGSA